MQKRITHQVQGDLFREWGNLLDDSGKEMEIHDLFCAYDFRAKAALKVTDVRDFYVNFFEFEGWHDPIVVLSLDGVTLSKTVLRIYRASNCNRLGSHCASHLHSVPGTLSVVPSPVCLKSPFQKRQSRLGPKIQWNQQRNGERRYGFWARGLGAGIHP
jgi:hypothetical protein